MSFLAPISYRLKKEWEPIDRLLQNHDKRIRDIVLIRILGGRLIIDKEVDDTGIEVFHTRDQVPVGCIIVKSSEAISYKTSDFNAKSITVTASSGSAVVSLWIF